MNSISYDLVSSVKVDGKDVTAIRKEIKYLTSCSVRSAPNLEVTPTTAPGARMFICTP